MLPRRSFAFGQSFMLQHPCVSFTSLVFSVGAGLLGVLALAWAVVFALGDENASDRNTLCLRLVDVVVVLGVCMLPHFAAISLRSSPKADAFRLCLQVFALFRVLAVAAGAYIVSEMLEKTSHCYPYFWAVSTALAACVVLEIVLEWCILPAVVFARIGSVGYDDLEQPGTSVHPLN